MKYSIVIPTYNHCDDLLKPCLESIFKYTDMQDVELIISANGCTDNTKSYLEELRLKFLELGFEKNFKVTWSDKPIGFSKANNVALRMATCNKIILLNNDIVLLPQDKNKWIELLEEEFTKDPNCGISCVLKRFSEAANATFAIFFCAMIDRKVFDIIGLLNEEYGKGGCEDTEFCIEAEKVGFTVHQAGPQIWSDKIQLFEGEFPIFHPGEGTVFDQNLVPDWQEIFHINLLKIAKKYNPSWTGLHTGDYKKDLLFLKNDLDNFYKEVIVGDEYHITQDNQMCDRNVIDIGANIGSFSVLAAYMGAKKVVSVEPVSSVYKMLKENSKCYPIIALQNVVTDKIDEVYKIRTGDFSGANSLYNVEGSYENIYSINLAKILEYFEGDNIFFKCDCEGAEYDIILNATQEQMNRISRICIEIHKELHPIYKGAEIIENKLTEFGFTMDSGEDIYHWEEDEHGNRFNFTKIPFKVEFWSRYA